MRKEDESMVLSGEIVRKKEYSVVARSGDKPYNFAL